MEDDIGRDPLLIGQRLSQGPQQFKQLPVIPVVGIGFLYKTRLFRFRQKHLLFLGEDLPALLVQL